MIKRLIEPKINAVFEQKKAVVLLGARQVGKTTLLHQIFDADNNALWLTGDDPDVQTMLEDVNSTRWKTIIGAHTTIISRSLTTPQRSDF